MFISIYIYVYIYSSSSSSSSSSSLCRAREEERSHDLCRRCRIPARLPHAGRRRPAFPWQRQRGVHVVVSGPPAQRGGRQEPGGPEQHPQGGHRAAERRPHGPPEELLLQQHRGPGARQRPRPTGTHTATHRTTGTHTWGHTLQHTGRQVHTPEDTLRMGGFCFKIALNSSWCDFLFNQIHPWPLTSHVYICIHIYIYIYVYIYIYIYIYTTVQKFGITQTISCLVWKITLLFIKWI